MMIYFLGMSLLVSILFARLLLTLFVNSGNVDEIWLILASVIVSPLTVALMSSFLLMSVVSM